MPTSLKSRKPRSKPTVRHGKSRHPQQPKEAIEMAIRATSSPASNPANLPATGFVRLKQLTGDPKANPPVPPIVPVGRSSIWRRIKEGTFPQPVKLGPMTTAWRVEDIRAWIGRQGAAV
jgi:predicted DNA-binding transcriptional regulator AlpA